MTDLQETGHLEAWLKDEEVASRRVQQLEAELERTRELLAWTTGRLENLRQSALGRVQIRYWNLRSHGKGI